MIHEVILALLGHCGEVIVPEYTHIDASTRVATTFRVSKQIDFLTPSERVIVDDIVHVGFMYSRLTKFIDVFGGTCISTRSLQQHRHGSYVNPYTGGNNGEEYSSGDDVAAAAAEPEDEDNPWIVTTTTTPTTATSSLSSSSSSTPLAQSAAAATATTAASGLYLSTFCRGLDACLENHRRTVLSAESAALDDPTFSLLHLRGMLETSRAVLSTLLTLAESVKPPRHVRALARMALTASVTQQAVTNCGTSMSVTLPAMPRDLHGCQILQAVTQTLLLAPPRVRACLSRPLHLPLQHVLLRQVSAWCAHGQLIDPHGEFFIQSENALSTTATATATTSTSTSPFTSQYSPFPTYSSTMASPFAIPASVPSASSSSSSSTSSSKSSSLATLSQRPLTAALVTIGAKPTHPSTATSSTSTSSTSLSSSSGEAALHSQQLSQQLRNALGRVEMQGIANAGEPGGAGGGGRGEVRRGGGVDDVDNASSLWTRNVLGLQQHQQQGQQQGQQGQGQQMQGGGSVVGVSAGHGRVTQYGSYVLRTDMVPTSIPIVTAQHILEIGKAVMLLQHPHIGLTTVSAASSSSFSPSSSSSPSSPSPSGKDIRELLTTATSVFEQVLYALTVFSPPDILKVHELPPALRQFAVTASVTSSVTTPVTSSSSSSSSASAASAVTVRPAVITASSSSSSTSVTAVTSVTSSDKGPDDNDNNRDVPNPSGFPVRCLVSAVSSLHRVTDQLLYQVVMNPLAGDLTGHLTTIRAFHLLGQADFWQELAQAAEPWLLQPPTVRAERDIAQGPYARACAHADIDEAALIRRLRLRIDTASFRYRKGFQAVSRHHSLMRHLSCDLHCYFLFCTGNALWLLCAVKVFYWLHLHSLVPITLAALPPRFLFVFLLYILTLNVRLYFMSCTD